jgi:hypothetical protein
MAIARKVLVVLAWLYLLGVVVQFFLAGLGLPELGGEGMDAHEGLGYSALHLTPILFIIAGLVGRVGRELMVSIVIFAVVAFVQPIWAAEFQGEFLASFHILGAAVILAMSYEIARRATRIAQAA